jgi:hypothetical protein
MASLALAAAVLRFGWPALLLEFLFGAGPSMRDLQEVLTQFNRGNLLVANVAGLVGRGPCGCRRPGRRRLGRPESGANWPVDSVPLRFTNRRSRVVKILRDCWGSRYLKVLAIGAIVVALGLLAWGVAPKLIISALPLLGIAACLLPYLLPLY